MNRTLDLVILLGTLAFAVVTLFFLSPYWGWFGLCFSGSLGLWELIAKIRTGRTLTQRFRAVMKEKPIRAWLFIIALNLFIIYLNWHLLQGHGG